MICITHLDLHPKLSEIEEMIWGAKCGEWMMMMLGATVAAVAPLNNTGEGGSRSQFNSEV